MNRLTIEISPDQHQKIKALAAMQGKSIKDYVMERVLPNDEDLALKELEAVLSIRISEADKGKLSTKSVSDVLQDRIQRYS